MTSSPHILAVLVLRHLGFGPVVEAEPGTEGVELSRLGFAELHCVCALACHGRVVAVEERGR